MELFSVKPNCEEVRMVFSNKFCHFAFKNFSNNLDNTDSREIGRNSSREVGDVSFGIGMTLAT